MVPFDHGPHREGEAVRLKQMKGEVLGFVHRGKAVSEASVLCKLRS